MEGGDCPVRRWEDLDSDILVKILQSFDPFELTSGLGQVCLCVANCLNLSCGNILTLIFHYNLYVSDNQLTYTAERCRRLKRLVMPAWNRINEIAICRAIRLWEDLESLTMPNIEDDLPYVMEEIGRSCKNFAELKIMGPCDMVFSSTLVAFLPNLKVVSVRCTVLSKPALVIILEGLNFLEVLNLSHCLITEDPPPAPTKILTKLDDSILEKASRLREFITCMSDSCIMCQRTRDDEGRAQVV
ncbi:hypothetical protein K7X08_025133 [Anisodus acutangulus]|uniref:F-box/LRR-repeat protein n=1 Tax=Anisodus acutangulus TaxID=402998 RepID=A0A9Q1ME61_9SOLA|nr:hypothetical protein K7X08_025133 [Anisodus acutangulus]